MSQLDAELPEDVRWIVDRMEPADKEAFNVALDTFEGSGIDAEDFARNLIDQGYPEILVRWGLHLPPRKPVPPAGFVLTDVGQTLIDAGKGFLAFMTAPPKGGEGQIPVPGSTGVAQATSVSSLPAPPDGSPPPISPVQQSRSKAAPHQAVRYTAAIFPVESGCQNAGTWNLKTIHRYRDTLNEFADQGWHLLRMDVIPFSSGCWPFVQKGNIYLLTFQSR